MGYTVPVMRTPRWLNLSLGWKCRLLFGVAVLLILAAALYVPWDRMNSLSDERYVARARHIATAATLSTDFGGQDWSLAQRQLAERWPALARAAGLEADTVPQLMPLETALGFPEKGFVHESVQALRADPTQQYKYKIRQDEQTGGQTVRLAWAVRAGPAEPNPGDLKGLVYVEIPKPAEHAFYNLLTVVGSGLGGGLLALLVFYLITTRLILSPVRELRGVAEQVTSGDLAIRSTIATGDEFEDLGEAFNDMLAHLKTTQDELRTTNRSLDIRLGELAETNVALFEANKLKTEFLANVSHELRTPLVSIIGFAELLRDAAESPPKDAKRPIRYADNILTSGRMLLDLINDLLDLAKIEAGRIDLHLSRVNLRDVCDALMDFLRPLADKKNLALEAAVEEGVPDLHSDSGKIKQILYNLLSNAIKFTPGGGRVRLEVGPSENETVHLRVSDTGPGIPAEMQAIIFEQFRQLDASATREHGGTGLGLTITRELVRMLGGSIQIESAEGQGSTFIVTLPRQSPQEAERRLIALT